MKEDIEKLYYGYRINKYISTALVGIGITGIVLAVFFTISGYSTWVMVLCWALGAMLLICGLFWHLSFGFVNDPRKMEGFHENFANQLQTLWDGKGRVLDIGTGLGRAAVEAAKRFQEAHVVGVDTWSNMWGYFGMTKAGAERNARIENVSDRCTFQNCNALELPFKNGEFRLVVSAFVFHEIRVPDRMVLFKEFFRVLAPGGVFLICDIFPKGYNVKSVAELLKKVERLGSSNVKFVNLKDAGVNLGRLAHIWQMGYLSGRKQETKNGSE